jgi:hypothetical protein
LLPSPPQTTWIPGPAAMRASNANPTTMIKSPPSSDFAAQDRTTAPERRQKSYHYGADSPTFCLNGPGSAVSGFTKVQRVRSSVRLSDLKLTMNQGAQGARPSMSYRRPLRAVPANLSRSIRNSLARVNPIDGSSRTIPPRTHQRPFETACDETALGAGTR